MTFYQYPDYMYHHGVKGMKWGVRKANRYSAGVTKNGKAVSNRKAARKINKAMVSKEGPERKKINKIMEDEYANSKERAAITNKSFTINDLQRAYNKQVQITNKYRPAMRSALLKDLGYDDTKAGRDYVTKLADKKIEKNQKKSNK